MNDKLYKPGAYIQKKKKKDRMHAAVRIIAVIFWPLQESFLSSCTYSVVRPALDDFGPQHCAPSMASNVFRGSRLHS
jgi:hypothetical protein